MGKRSWVDDLLGSTGKKKDNSGKYWKGGHETTRGGKKTGTTTHYAHQHSGDRKAHGWSYDWKGGKSKKF